MASRPADAGGPEAHPESTGPDPVVRLPVEDSLDLHTFAPRDIPDLVREYISECVRCGFREVRVIHGRGTGTQRTIVRAVLGSHALVEAFADAPPDRGGWGATVVRLRDDPNALRNSQ
jgi:dsDNA-specific endonuclease/ATPase MutS2